ncbi:MAG: glycosyltransferase [Deltaproteobacteria bacterium]|nr:glycosyltransferase [Deltaproteobacteria bacterium]
MTTHVLWILIHCLALVIFVNRYLAGVVLRLIRGDKWDEKREDYEPTVTVVIPMFNEGAAIKETLQSILDSDYPKHKLEVVCMDDCSTDNSFEMAREVARSSGGRLKVIRNRQNLGKRRSINRAVRSSDREIIVSVDSDVVVDKAAIRQLVQRFTSDRIAAVGGWVDIRNKHENWLTRMQVVKYWYGYYFMKNLEWGFRRVMCLSGCLTAYRRSVLVELEPVLESRAILGVPIKYGEDRFLTRQIVKAGYLTTMTLDARCRTFAPATLSAYFSQQLRWRRSNIVDYAGAFSHVWRLNPILAIHFFAQFAILIAYPLAVIRALASFRFFPALQLHIYMMVVFGLYYCWRVRKQPKEERVGPLAFLPLSLLMPITYALLTPLALFTLDSGSWETRGHDPDDPAGAQPVIDIGYGTGQHALLPAPALEPVHARASQAQLPAA